MEFVAIMIGFCIAFMWTKHSHSGLITFIVTWAVASVLCIVVLAVVAFVFWLIAIIVILSLFIWLIRQIF